MAINLRLSESEEMLRTTAQDFMQRDAPKAVVQALQVTDTGCTDELWKKMADMGWLGVIIPEEYGGTGNPLTSAGVLFEVLGRGPLPGPYFSSAILGALIVMEAGTEEQKKGILPDVVSGQKILTMALTEPEYSWEPSSVQVTATASNGDFVLNGTKLFVSDAAAATDIIVVARTGKEADPSKGIGLFVVDSKSAGVSIRRLPGFLTGRIFEVKLDSVKVPKSTMLGGSTEGWVALQEAIEKAIPVLCAYKVGGSQALMDMALEHTRTREQFGQAVGRFQRVQDMIIEMVTYIDGARWATYEALWKLDTNRPAKQSVHLAKVVASEGYFEVVTLAHRAFSGISYSIEHPVSFHTRASRALYTFLGDPPYHRQQLAKFLVP